MTARAVPSFPSTIQYPDGSLDTTLYSSNTVTHTDPSSKSTKQTLDALGRILPVAEDPFNKNFLTSYCYDGLDDLIYVNQGSTSVNCLTLPGAGGQVRSFQYNSLKEWISAQSPEVASTAITYSYYDSGDLQTKAAPGALKSETYPSGRAVTTTYDAAGRPIGVSGQQTPSSRVVSYAGGTLSGCSDPSGQGVCYAPHGAIAQLPTGDGLLEITNFDNRLRPTQIQAGPLATLGYTYYANGNVQTHTIYDGSTYRSQGFSYDGLNRLTVAAEVAGATAPSNPTACPYAGGTWCQTYVYDPSGNRALLNPVSSDPSTGMDRVFVDPTTDSTSVPFDTNNHWTFTGAHYDQRGNLDSVTLDSNDYYHATYDAENRVVSATAVAGGTSTTISYGYDGDGRRVYKSISGGATTSYACSASGELIAEYSTATNPDTGTQYLTTDALGSTRLIRGSTVNRSDYLPFGQEIPATWNRSNYIADSNETLKFTSKERDAETGLDYFGERYFSGAQGRFTSADQPFNDQYPIDPQSWNLYSYVRNNPLKYRDLNGEDCVYTNNAANGTVGLERGDSCSQQGGTYVNGTVDAKSFTYDAKTNSIGYTYSNAAEGTGGAGSIGLPNAPTREELGLLALN